MHPNRRTLVAITVAFITSAAALAQSSYVPGDLDPVHVLASGQALRIGADGMPIGIGIPIAGNTTQAVVFDPLGAQVLNPLPGDDGGIANDRNALGVVVGTSVDQVNIGPHVIQFEHPASWTGGVVVDLRTTLAPDATTLDLRSAISINASGQIVCLGVDQTLFDGNHTVILDGGFVTDIGSLAIGGHSETVAAKIDDLGRVVGYSFAGPNTQHAFLWDTTQLIDLHAQASIQGSTSQAWDINRFGQVVGSADHAGGLFDKQVATVWDTSGLALDLGTLGGDQSVAYGINDLGVVCGFSYTTVGDARAFLWKNGTMVDMNKLVDPATGWVLINARDIDELGRVVGDGEFQGATRAFIAEPQCDGTYTVYGSACPSPGSAPTPLLQGFGCPSAGEPIALEISQLIPFVPGLLVVGGSNGAAPIQPSCLLQTLPLTSVVVSLPLAPPGGFYLPFTLPPVLPIVDVYVQAVFLFAPTQHAFGPKPLKIHLQ